MGTKFAPIYATLAIAYLEERLYIDIKTHFGDTFGNYFEKYWKRFLDDCFIPWTRPVTDLTILHDVLNNLHTDINFTKECSPNEQAFLDVLVKNTEGIIHTDIYYKPTDSKQYLLFESSPATHKNKYTIFPQRGRLKTIVSDDTVLQTRIQALKLYLRKQHYPVHTIETGIQKALQLDRDVLLKIKTKSSENIIPFVSTYNPKNPDLFNVIKCNTPILHQDNRMKQIFSKFKFIKSKRQPQNLKKLLTKAKFEDSSITPEC